MTTSRVPQYIGRYEIKGEIGRGGMGAVYRGYDLHVKRDVAVKVLPREFLHDPTFRARFEREAQTIALLEHPAIVPLYDFGDHEGQPFFVMRFMTGGSLSQRLRQGALTLESAAQMLNRLAPALDEVHSQGIIHRDLKPGNILFDQRGDAYISDFGIAKLSQQGISFTASGIIGTPAYMSPEQARGEADLDGRSDIYVMGAILFEVLSGRQPFEADTPMGLLLKHISDPVPRLHAFNPMIPTACESVIAKAMAKERDQRYATATSMAAELAAIARGESPPTQPAQSTVARARPAPPPAAQPTGGVPAWFWGLIGLGVIGLLIGLLVGNIGAIGALLNPTATLSAAQIQQTQSVEVAATAQAALLATTDAETRATVEALEAAAVASTATARAQSDAASAATQSIVATANAIANATATQIANATANAIATAGSQTTATAQAQATANALLSAPRIAFLNADDVWVVNADGSNLKRLTTDGGKKSNLRWMPDGRNVAYILGRCVHTVDFITLEAKTFVCFNSAETFDGFEVTPDSKRFAISLNRILYVGDYNAEALGKATSPADLAALSNCLVYSGNSVKAVRWARNGEQIALIALIPIGSGAGDSVRLFNLICNSDAFFAVDEFPGLRFSLPKYSGNPQLHGFGWDGSALFSLVDVVRNEGFGNLYVYNASNKRNPAQVNPIDDTCCYRDAHWSVDGSQFTFAFQDIRLGAASKTELYLIQYGTIGTGVNYSPIPLPADMLTNPRENPQPVIAP